MAVFDFMAVSREGHRIRGVITGKDKHDVANQLKSQGLWLIWYKEKAEGEPVPPPTPATPPPVETLKKEPLPEKIDAPPESATGLVGWVIDHSAGSVRTKKQARMVLALTGIFLVVTVVNAFWNLYPRAPYSPHPPVNTSGKLLY